MKGIAGCLKNKIDNQTISYLERKIVEDRRQRLNFEFQLNREMNSRKQKEARAALTAV